MVDESSRRKRRSRLAGVFALAVLLLLTVLWRAGSVIERARSSQSNTPPRVVEAGSIPQPDSNGYEYLVTVEQYQVLQQNGELQLQERRRESWRATDGWVWARQTGTDPGRFIFPPNTDARLISGTSANEASVRGALRRILSAVPVSQVGKAEFNLVTDLLGDEALPAASLPKSYRQLLVQILKQDGGATVISNAEDPRGRAALSISVSPNADVTQVLYLDKNYVYLASTTEDRKTQEGGSRVAVERGSAAQVPDELLRQVGNKRVARADWE